MLKAETTSTRSPRGTKPVSDAFFAALGSVPMVSRAVVAKAAQAMIRDELKMQRDKTKAAAIKQKTVQPATAKAITTMKKKSLAVKAPVAARSSTKAKAATKKANAPVLKLKTKEAAKPVAEVAPKKSSPKKTAAVKGVTKPAETPAAA